MKQLLFLILAICAVLLIGCQQENAFEDPTETDQSVLDTTWQDATQIHQTEITEDTTSTSKEGSETDNKGSLPTGTEPNATTPPTTETKPKVEETVPPTETTEPTTMPTEETKPQGPAATVPHETTVTTPRETVPTEPRDNPEVTEPSVTEPPATTVPVTTEAPTEPKTQPSEPSEPPKPTATEPTEFDINYWITFAKDYAEKIGLTLDEEAIWCWDNPITASVRSKYLERDICGILDRYSKDPDITAVWIWSEKRNDSVWNIYIGYA